MHLSTTSGSLIPFGVPPHAISVSPEIVQYHSSLRRLAMCSVKVSENCLPHEGPRTRNDGDYATSSLFVRNHDELSGFAGW